LFYFRKQSLLLLIVFFLTVFLSWPIISLIILSFGDSKDLWFHLYDTVLIKYISNTLILMIGTVIGSLAFGLSTAWIVTNFEFKLKNVCDFILILPAACPAYLVAYAYTDFFEYAGPIQKYLREIGNWNNPNEYYFPEIRSLGGAIFVLSSVLYPYVYILCRTSFRQTPQSLKEINKIYGYSDFWKLSLPLARPAIVVGIALVCMEVVSDFGTVEYFSIETLTLGIFNVWIGMNNITAASQIAVFTFLFIIGLLVIEKRYRSSKRYNDTTYKQTFIVPSKTSFLKSILFSIVCFFPFFCGFLLPIIILIKNVLNSRLSSTIFPVWEVLFNTIFISICGAVLIMVISTIIACTTDIKKNKILNLFANFSASGYAFPGTILAIGVLATAGFFDKITNKLSIVVTSSESNFFLSGTILVLLIAYLIRFNAIGFGSVVSGLSKTSPNIFSASRTLGNSINRTITKITIPLITKSIVAGGILCFVDIMKELPMTLLLRPFNFETLATYTYQYAHSELMSEASLSALLIIVVGLIPIIFLNNYLRN
tara:strand:+ start:114 stop:1733 length:1620 start_codon:yes stop_codon:yes gene_type:complete